MARGHIKKRSKRSWTLVLSLGVDPGSGKRRQKWVTVKGTKRDADSELARLLAEFDRGTVPTSGRLTVEEYLQEWLSDVVIRRNRPRTHEGYRALVKNHLVPAFGAVQLNNLEPRDVNRMLTTMREKGLTENTLRHAWVVLGKALNDAGRLGLVSRNVARLIEPPRPEAVRIEPPNIESVRKILDAAPSDVAPIIRFMAATGVRRGEAVGLRWANVDFDKGVVAIVESAQRLADGSLSLAPPKSAAGRRGIAIDEATVALLRKHRAAQSSRILSLGGAYDDRGLVFAAPLGELMDPDRVTRGFRATVRKLGLSGVRLHDLRHAHATELIRAGVHPRVVQDRLGHSSAAFTMDRYGHVAADLQAEAAAAYGRRFSASVG